MKITYQAANEMSDAAARKATGKSWDEWFKLIDKFGGAAKGRRAIGEFLMKQHSMDPWWTATMNVEYEKARNVVEKDGAPKGYNICVTKAVKAQPAQLFDAFSKPAALAKWLGAGAKVDFREGGGFSNSDGNRGTIKKINPGKLIRFTWEGGPHAAQEVVEVKFQPSGAKCSVLLSHDRIQSREVADGLRAAWGEAFERLKVEMERA